MARAVYEAFPGNSASISYLSKYPRIPWAPEKRVERHRDDAWRCCYVCGERLSTTEGAALSFMRVR